jgi:hypothetical protein
MHVKKLSLMLMSGALLREDKDNVEMNKYRSKIRDVTFPGQEFSATMSWAGY